MTTERIELTKDRIGEAGRKISIIKARRHGTLRMGLITDYDSANMTLSAEIDGALYFKIKYMDHMAATIAIGRAVWLHDMGAGRWVAVGTSG